RFMATFFPAIRWFRAPSTIHGDLFSVLLMVSGVINDSWRPFFLQSAGFGRYKRFMATFLCSPDDFGRHQRFMATFCSATCWFRAP
ncbi:hypothetical protein, partial [Bacillus sp. J33]|uniref:hypothetical protein n=1 Tax=Bacillus sp. J33 TaxID=935836 RepID=UPI0018DE086C